MSEWLESPYFPYILGGGVVVLTTIVLVKKFKRSPRPDYPRDKVILHLAWRGPRAPSLSPFPIKLETYLKMAKIPFVPNPTLVMSKKHKTPWITYNDDDVADSQFCIEYLNEKFNVDLNSHLTAEQKAIGRAFQTLVEDNLYWLIVIYRWEYMDAQVLKKLLPPMPWYAIPMYRYYLKKQTHAQGMGGKKFLLGDQASEYDCSIFGFMVQFLWQMSGTAEETYMKENCKNLVEYCERMKTTYWPDWDECITHGHTRPAAK